jgi:3-oxoacyl-ACP reductase-like protein
LLIPGAISLFQFFLALHVNKKYVKGKPYKKVELEGKVYIVTGSNTGIGYETARALVEMGATVIMACRSVDKANEARTSILAKVKCAPSKVYVSPLNPYEYGLFEL